MHPERPAVVDWLRTARRLGLVLASLAVVVVLVWLIEGLIGAGLRATRLAEFLGFGLLGAVVIGILVVGGAALGGMMAAGARGDRLAREDVALAPPQLLRGRARPRVADSAATGDRTVEPPDAQP